MISKKKISIHRAFKRAKTDKAWSFDDKRSIDSWTHGYHRYPAKFVPELVKKIIEEHTSENDLIVDVFAGCGTTLVESKIHGRRCIGIDINPVAALIAEAKINAIDPKVLDSSFVKLRSKIKKYSHNKNQIIAKHTRLNYWFRKWERHKINYLHLCITAIRDKRLRVFYLCALSNILKNSSRWLQSSTKPQVDPQKKLPNPFHAFERQVKAMIVKNKKFYEELKSKERLNGSCKIKIADAKDTGIKTRTASIVITSPPYVTSYEYADIHQLTSYWFNYVKDIHSFRKKFIGTFYSNKLIPTLKDPLAERIVNRLRLRDPRTAREVANYFNDMYDVSVEINRILKENGKACLVIGNTKLFGVKIKSAEVMTNYLSTLNFKVEKIIRRNIPTKHKLIPTIRDNKTGRFSKLGKKNSKLVYPNEYIIIAKKAA